MPSDLVATLASHSGTSSPLRRGASSKRNRTGSITVLSAFFLVVTLAIVALAIDLGCLLLSRTQAQASADSAAAAGAWELLELRRTGKLSHADVRQVAASYAALNKVHCDSPSLALNADNDAGGGVVLASMRDYEAPDQLDYRDAGSFNTVRVRVSRTQAINGEIPTFFGKILGSHSVGTEVMAQATFWTDFKGFKVPDPDSDPPENLMLLPFAYPHADWAAAKTKVELENKPIDLYPLETGCPGNFGTVDIGSDSTTVPVLRRQIVDGVNQSDLDYHGGALRLDTPGGLKLSADPGLKAGPVHSSISAIIGQKRIIPLYSKIDGSGNPAEYTITGFAAVQIVGVDMHGGDKYLHVKPAAMITRGGIRDKGKVGTTASTDLIFSPVILTK